ncbi:His Kinase A (phospho-acceptor) domain-containing protein [Fodinibius roseus]|uniref:histidine kinase n=1 Tax=Fodinibius roseus TaxID=1194090 RepID=A0A1M5K342_9BACT|nr:hybrid sensor histidine kinase/response regulator [Fodinibius roseus]SHG47165.1 His Kinase A (phospho-acceptor) domain-containing protein [Fodinibius roseus]
MKEAINTNVLVIDDEEMVRDNIKDILVPPGQNPEEDAIDKASSILFDEPQTVLEPRNSNIPDFTVDTASNGMEGAGKVKQAVSEGKPYAVIFLDMRMPGWDGLETAMEIRKHDKKAEIIFITAYSDRSIQEIVNQAGQNVGYHCKPYATEEITQLATKAVTDYNKLRNLEQLIEVIASINLDEHQLRSVLQNILDQLATYIETDMALLGKLHQDHTYEKIFSIGPVEEEINIDELISLVQSVEIPKEEEVIQVDEVVLAQMEDYTIFAILNHQEKLKTEKLYLLRLYVLNAAKAIRNAELHEKMLQKEKLSAVGNAVSMVMHDLRSPIKNIPLLTDLLREDDIESEYLDMIDESADQASEIFDDFLDFLRKSPVEKKPVDVTEIVHEGIKLAESRSEQHDIEILTDIPGALKVHGDESKLKRTVMNLVHNAMEVLKNTKIEDPQIRILAHQNNNGKTILRVRDNGPGIPSNILKTLFEPFVTEQKSTGTGLGLAIVKQYVTAHGGTIDVENDNGALFTVTLPDT